MNNKKIVICASTGRSTRDLLRTDVIKGLIREGIKVIIVSPASDECYFKKEFSDENITIFPYLPPSRIERIIFRIWNTTLINTNYSLTLKIKSNVEKSKIKKYMLILGFFNNMHIRRLFFGKLLSGKNIGLRNVLRIINGHVGKDKYKKLMDECNPDLIFTITDLGNEMSILKSSIKHDIPSCLMIFSWDYITCKGDIPVNVDNIIVWNEIQKMEVKRNYGLDCDIFVSGPPQFDIYFNKKCLIKRDLFLENIGGDNSKKIVTFSVNGFPIDFYILDVLISIMESVSKTTPFQLVIRLNPHINNSEYYSYSNYDDVIIDDYWRKSDIFRDKWDPSEMDMLHFSNLLYHSDILINIASTLTIEACCLDTPVINIDFDEKENISYYESINCIYDYEHMKPILNSKAIRIAHNKESLKNYIVMYLNDPKIDSFNRKELALKMCNYDDGNSGKRISNYLKKIVDQNH